MTSVLITGASSGIGAGLAREYGQGGATVGLIARRGDLLEEVAAEVERLGGRAHVLAENVCDTESTAARVEEFSQKAGGIDIAIANAGIGEGVDGERFDAAKVARVFEVNIIGLSNTLLPAAHIMRSQQSGSLVGVASVAAFRAMPGSLAYSASKAAVMTFMEGLAMELTGTGVHAMSLCPGFIRTPLTDRNDFPMPFLLECDEACRRMKKAIERRDDRYVFPFPMAVAARVLQVAPRWLLQKALPQKGFRSEKEGEAKTAGSASTSKPLPS